MNLKNLLPYLLKDPVPLTLGEKLRTTLASFAAILLAGWISSRFVSGPGLPLLVASMGASAVLIFAVSQSPLAQPWPFVGGHLFSAFIGVTCAQFVPDLLLSAALAVAGSILVMHLLRCLHPPGGAAALAPVLGANELHDLGYQFILTPVALNVFTVLVLALVINNLLLKHRYPARPSPKSDSLHTHGDLSPLDRLGVNQSDIKRALADMNVFLDVTEEDLRQVYRLASARSYRRKMGEVTCADIMSRDITTVEYATEIEEVWALLRYHKVKSIPVIDRARRVIGIVSLVDILKHANLKTYETFEDKLINFVRRTSGLTSDKPEVVGHIMAKPVFTVKEGMHVVELVPLLSERGLHHIPVVDEEERLVGMVTQSDLIAALYAGTVSN